MHLNVVPKRAAPNSIWHRIERDPGPWPGIFFARLWN